MVSLLRPLLFQRALILKREDWVADVIIGSSGTLHAVLSQLFIETFQIRPIVNRFFCNLEGEILVNGKIVENEIIRTAHQLSEVHMNCGSVTFTVDIRPSPHRNITTRPRLDIPNCVSRFCWIVNHDLVLKTAPGRMCSGLVYPRTGPKVDSQYVWSSWSWHRKLFGTLSTCLLRLAEPRYQPQRKNGVPQKRNKVHEPWSSSL